MIRNSHYLREVLVTFEVEIGVSFSLCWSGKVPSATDINKRTSVKIVFGQFMIKKKTGIIALWS